MKNRIVAVIGILALAASSLAAQIRTAEPLPLAVQSATPADLKLEKGGSATVTLSGTGLRAVTSAQLVANERTAVSGVKAEVSPLPSAPGTSVTSIRVRLSAQWDAKEGGDFLLRLVAGDKSLIVPLSLLKAAVVWPQPRITSCPEEAAAGSVITLRGTGLGHGRESDRTKVVVSFTNTHTVNPVYGEVQSVAPTEIKVRVPSGARTSRVAVVTPGGHSYSSRPLRVLYIQHFSPDIFQLTGTLGSLLHISESFFALAHGDRNSAFNPSSAMSKFGAQQLLFTYPPRDERVDLVVGSTIFRVRLKGTNRMSAADSLRTTSFGVRVDRTNLVIDLVFEKDGTEFIGEYETQDILTKRIHWKHCLNLEADDLKVTITLPFDTSTRLLSGIFSGGLKFGEIKASASFTPRFSVLGSPPFTIEEGPIREDIKKQTERDLNAALNSQGFKDMFNGFLTTYIRGLYQGTPVTLIKVQEASDGGLDWIAW